MPTSETYVEQFERLMGVYYKRLFSQALQIARNFSDAEDLLQDTAIKIFRAMDRLTTEKTFLSWAIRIMTRCWQDTLRSRRRRHQAESIDALQEQSDLDIDFEDKRVDILKDIFAREYIAERIASLNELPEMYRDTLLMKYGEDMSYKEIAEKMDSTEATVKCRGHRGRQLLLAAT